MATIKLNPSTSPSVELSSYRDQHFKVSFITYSSNISILIFHKEKLLIPQDINYMRFKFVYSLIIHYNICISCH